MRTVFLPTPSTTASPLVFLCPFTPSSKTPPVHPHRTPPCHQPFSSPRQRIPQASQTSRHGVTPGPLYVFPTPFSNHLRSHTSPAKPSFPACFAYPNLKPNFTQFHSHAFLCLFILLRATGFPVTPPDPGPAPSPASGFRPSGLSAPVSPGVLRVPVI